MGGPFWMPAAALIPANKPAVQVANWGVAVLLATGAASCWRWPAPPAAGFIPRCCWRRSGSGRWCASRTPSSESSPRALYSSGVHGAVNFPALPGASAATAAAAHHTSAVLDLAVFEPWFLIEGVLLLLAGRQFLRTPTDRRR